MIIIAIIKPVGFGLFILLVQLEIRNASDSARIVVAWGYAGADIYIFSMLLYYRSLKYLFEIVSRTPPYQSLDCAITFIDLKASCRDSMPLSYSKRITKAEVNTFTFVMDFM